MNNIIKAIKLDFYVSSGSNKSLLYFFMLASVIGIIDKNSTFTTAFVVIMAAPFFGRYFSIYEKNHLNMLYGILPLRKTDVVIGKYLYAFLFAIVVGIFSILLSYVVSLIISTPMIYLNTVVALLIGFLFYSFYIAISLPLYFSFPFSKVYIYSTLPYFLLIPIVLFIYKKTNIMQNISSIIQYYMGHQYMIWITGLGLGLLLLIISLPISNYFYRRYEMQK